MPSAQYCWNDRVGHKVGPVPETYVLALLEQGVLPPGTPLQSPDGVACGVAGDLAAGVVLSGNGRFDPDIDPWDEPEEAAEEASATEAETSPAQVESAPVESASVESVPDAGALVGAYDPDADVWDEDGEEEAAEGAWSREIPEGFDGAWVDADVLADEPEAAVAAGGGAKVSTALELVRRHRFSDAQDYIANHLSDLRHEPDALTLLAYARFRLASSAEEKASQLALVEEQIAEDPGHFVARAFAARMHLALMNKQSAMDEFAACERLVAAGKGALDVFAELRTTFAAARASEARREARVRAHIVEETLPHRGLSAALAVTSVLMLVAAFYGPLHDDQPVASLFVGITGAILGGVWAVKTRRPARSLRAR